MDLRGNVRRWLGRPTTYLSGEWNRMAPRERRLVAALVGAVGAFGVLLTGFLIVDSLREIGQANDDARDALGAIAKHKDEYLEAKARMVAQEVRIGTEPPQLMADLEAAAREVGIQIPEQNDAPPQMQGKRYLEHKVDIKLRQVDLQSLSRFLAKVETGRRLIVITRLGVRRRFEGEKLDAEISAVSYERVKEAPLKKRPAAGKGTKT